MKKTLLFLASALMSTGLFAQSFTATWEKPVVTNFVDMADDGETTQFLYNVGAKGFLAGHNDWNTRASVADKGDSIRVKALQEGKYNLSCYPAAYTNKNKWLYVAANSWKAQWVDAGNATGNDDYPGTDQWVFTKQDNNSYKITNTGVGEDRDLHPEDGYQLNPGTPEPGTWGVASTAFGETPNTRCYFYDPDFIYVPDIEGEYMPVEKAIPADADFWDEWRFVSVEEYTNVYVPAQQRYAAAVNLKEKIEYALNNGIEAEELAEQFAVYNNLESTTEELNKAAEAAYDKGRWVEIKEFFEDIVDGEQNDVSGVFTNNDFSDGSANGWDITWTANSKEATNIGYQANSDYTYGEVTLHQFIEAWKNNSDPNYLGDGSITQTVPSLPAGKYMLAVDVVAHYQYGNGTNNNRPDDVELFAKASLDGKEYSTAMATGNGQPEHFDFTFIHTGGAMTLGLRVIGSAEATVPANWIAMDNLKLYYYGEVTDDPDKVLLDDYMKGLVETHDPEEVEDYMAYTGDKNNYIAAFSSAADISENGGDYMAAKTALEAAVAQLEKSVKAYQDFNALFEEANERIEEFDGTKFSGIAEAFGDFLSDWSEAYEEGLYTIEEIAALPNLLSKTINDYVSEYLEPGDDITFMIKNPNFDKDFSGWETTGAGVVWGGADRNNTLGDDDAVLASGNAERWHDTFTMSQTVYNMPAGLYQFTCQGFTRCDDGSKNEGALYAIVNGEEQTSLLPLLNAYPTSSSLYDPGEWTRDSEVDGGFVPNSMTGANYHFNHTTEGNEFPDYTTTLNISLTEMADVTVGVKCTSKLNWVIFDNFQLKYLGSGNNAYLIAINQKLKDLKAYLDENEGNVGTDALDLYEAYDYQAQNLGDGEGEGAALLQNVEDAIVYAENSVKAYAEVDTKLSELDNARDESENDDAITAADNFKGLMEDKIGNRELTVEEVNAATAEIKKLIDQLNTPAYATASDDEPVDFTKRITNASFETGDLTGWTYNSGNDTKVYENSNATYTIDLNDGTYVFNTWANTAVEGGKLWLSQNIGILPAGTYKLEAALASFPSHILNFGINDDLTTFVNQNEKGKATNYEFIFILDEDTEVTITTSTELVGNETNTPGETFFKADDYRLTYYGTESAKEATPVEIEDVEENAPAKANGTFLRGNTFVIIKNNVLFNIAGQRLQ